MAAANKKREARKSVQQSGWVTLDGGFAARQCVVQDLSSSGGRITVDDASVLEGIVSPKDRFDLRNEFDPLAMRVRLSRGDFALALLTGLLRGGRG